MAGIFTISLDFELHWGGVEKWPLTSQKQQYFRNTRTVIPQLLHLFKDYGVHVTWATVGLLMHKNRASLLAHAPDRKPQYLESKLSVYEYLEKVGIGEDENSDPFHYADSLIREIIQTPDQELGSHSFSHYYCNEEGQTVEDFKEDLEAVKRAFQFIDRSVHSYVFPRNQYQKSYLKACSDAGIRIVRINPQDWWWQINSTQNESLWKRLNRGADAYFNIGGKTSYELSSIVKEEGVWLLPASRLLRPYNPNEEILNQQKIRRIKKEMTRASVQNEVYHLWWHPHNFGLHPKENMDGLIQILEHFQKLNQTNHMRSLHMKELAQLLDQENR